ncbi:sensor histidine kinase [Duganella sp. FT109W]|uniref:Sensor histidine kinase n=1 Tax=Duganella margarita TaxID=2692170 RepID=A0ABW9WI39_9BURK|nr:histidine kinase [Duganella margarita]MYN40083.1 sensor histidine kinase [Duganella margarita]
MHRTRTVIALAWLLFWLLMITTSVQEYLRDHDHGLWKPVLWEGSSALTGTLLLLAQRHFTRRYDHLIDAPLRWFARQLVWLPVYWLAFVPVAFGIRHAVYAWAGEPYPHGGWAGIYLYEDIKMTVFFFIFATITFGVLSFHAMLDEKLRVERANASLREAQLLRLSQQMQPHFLFNALNTISSLMYSDVARADAMLVQLSDVLRATLDVGERHLVPLEMELRLLRGYAALMAERFSDRVSIAWQVDDTLLACAVPVMSMQPLLENVFKHTVEKRRQPTAITLSVQRQQDMLVLRVEDDAGLLPAATPAAGGPAAGSAANADRSAGAGGIGVRNLRQRLAALYGDQAAFDLIQLSPAGVRAEVRLPCAS